MRRAHATALLAALALAGCPSEEKGGCPSGLVPCGLLCLDPASFQTDADNCGACGIACGIGTCAGGVCQCEGVTSCPAQNPRCADTQNDPQNCGACGDACTRPGEGCQLGVCGCYPPDDDDCGTFCTDTLDDPANCGPDASACGNDCPLLNDVCVGGACACPASLPDACPTRCVDTDTDAANCGTCGNACPLTNDVCIGGVCACPGSLPDVCGTTCVNLDTDERHCGACGTTCPTGATCTAGGCGCPAGQSVCGTACVDLQTDERHCGACATACPATATCTSGDCACGASAPQLCVATCCAGTGCCGDGSSCQTAHWNGLNASYYDCGALGEHTLDQARLAALSWSPTVGETVELGLQCQSCVCRQTSAQSAIWCAVGSNGRGRVLVTATHSCLIALCPSASTGAPWE